MVTGEGARVSTSIGTLSGLAGDGSIDMNDRMTLISPLGFSAATDYEIKVIWVPSDWPMCSRTFSG